MVIGNWGGLTRARAGWKNLSALLDANPREPERTALPAPTGQVALQGVVAIPPMGRVPSLRGLTFSLQPGQALGVIGPSASGKTTLAKLLCGAWPVTSGALRLDGATLDQWHPRCAGSASGLSPPGNRAVLGHHRRQYRPAAEHPARQRRHRPGGNAGRGA